MKYKDEINRAWWIIPILVWFYVGLIIGYSAHATGYDPGWPDVIVCKYNGQDNELVYEYEMNDIDGFFYGVPNARSYSYLGTTYVLFNSDQSYNTSYNVGPECQHNISSLATSSRAFNYGSTATTTNSFVTIVDDPTRNLFYGFILFFIMFFGILFFIKKRKGVR